MPYNSAAQRNRWGDIYANTPTKKMIALYDYDPMELSPNVDMEVITINWYHHECYHHHLYIGRAVLPHWRHHHSVWGDGRRWVLHGRA